MSVADDKYKVLYEKLVQLGFRDPTEIDRIIDQLNSFANLIIDLYLNKKQK